MKRGLIFGGILTAALIAFEIFNFSTTDFALTDFLGEARFVGVRWATILAVAFCGIDFAGLARLFTPEKGQGEPVEVWYLIGAWFLGATLNAVATWWAVSLALLSHEIGNEILSREQVLTYVPIFVAALVWLTRILIISTFSVAGERLFSQAELLVRPQAALRREATASVGQADARSAPARRGPARIIGEVGDAIGGPRPAPRPTAAAGARPVIANAVGRGPRDDAYPPRPLTRPAPKPSGNPPTTRQALEGFPSPSLRLRPEGAQPKGTGRRLRAAPSVSLAHGAAEAQMPDPNEN